MPEPGSDTMSPAPRRTGRLFPPLIAPVLMFALGTGVYIYEMANQPAVSETPWFSISVPASVEMIGENAFWDCGGLLYIFYEGDQEGWNTLYPQKITENTQIYRMDPQFPGEYFEP